MSGLPADDLRDRPSYPAAEAGRLVGLSPGRVRRWLRGYGYLHAGAVRRQAPVVRREGARGTSYASFLDLVDLLFVKRFLDHGVSLQRVRAALEEHKGDAILELLSGGQWTIAPLIEQLSEQIEFDSPGGLARRWYPLGRERHVVLDPSVGFGRPVLVGRGVATANVYDLFRAENERVEAVRAWWDLTDGEVEAAVEFERHLAA